MALRAKTQQVTRPVHGLSPMARAHAEGQGLPDFYGTGEDDLKTANVFTVSCYAARAQYLVTLHGLACKRQESPKVGQPTAIRPREPFRLVDAGAELTRCAGFVLTRVRPMNALVSRWSALPL